MRKSRRSQLATVGMCFALVSLAGCVGTSPAQGGERSLTVYNGGSGAFAENWNPFSPTVLSNVTGFVYESLFFFNPLESATAEPVPILGETFSFNQEGTVLSIETQTGITWSDGEDFTAEDVVFTFNLIKSNPALDTTGNAPTAVLIDDTHLELTFEKPSFVDGPSFLGTTYIVPEHIWSGIGDPATDINADPIGTGPMVVESFTPQSYLFEKNDAYRDADDLEVDSVRLLSLSGNEAATSQLLARDLDWSGINIPDIDAVLGSREDIGYFLYGSAQVVLTTCSNAELGCVGPQTDPAVRHAIEAAVDREQLIQLGNAGNGSEISPTFSVLGRDDVFIAPEVEGAEPLQPDVDLAAEILEEAGWRRGSDGIYAKDGERLSLRIQVTSGYTNYITTLEVLTEQLRTAGIEIQTQQLANSENNSSQSLGNFEVAIGNLYQGPAPDPYYLYSNFFYSKSTGAVGESVNPYSNVSRFSNPLVDAAIEEAAATDDIEVRASAYAKLQPIIVEELPYIPLFDSSDMAQHTTTKFTGWPSEKDPYARLSPGTAPDNAQILMNLEPVE